jgi:RNase P protein component
MLNTIMRSIRAIFRLQSPKQNPLPVAPPGRPHCVVSVAIWGEIFIVRDHVGTATEMEISDAIEHMLTKVCDEQCLREGMTL